MGRYFASFVMVTDDRPLSQTDTEVGIDLGLATFAVVSDGTTIASPKFLRQAERRLRKVRKALSRKEKGSANPAEARIKRSMSRITPSKCCASSGIGDYIKDAPWGPSTQQGPQLRLRRQLPRRPRPPHLVVDPRRRPHHRTDPNLPALQTMSDRAEHAYWLDPEPARSWSTGDSAAHAYATHITMHECRNVKQLAEVISRLLPT